MFFLKKVILSALFCVLMYYGGAGTQSDSTSLQGMGFVGVILAFVILYILFKVMWTAMSFVMAFAIIGGVVLFILYCLGLIGAGGGAADKIAQQVFSENDTAVEYTPGEQPQEQNVAGLEAIDSHEDSNQINNSTPQENESGGFFSKLTELFDKKEEAAQISNFNPLDYPKVSGKPHVITGSVLRLKGTDIKLLGIDAPSPDQTCSNARGQAYSCGQKSINWLQDWLNGQKVVCHIVGNVIKHRATGVCFLGQNDVAAAVVNAGWAVAYTKNTDIYVPYEKQARENLHGMWNGRFYRPSDWRKLQARQAAAIAQSKKSDWLNFDGWF